MGVRAGAIGGRCAHVATARDRLAHAKSGAGSAGEDGRNRGLDGSPRKPSSWDDLEEAEVEHLVGLVEHDGSSDVRRR